MRRPNTNNAHIRSAETTRENPEVKAEDAARLLNDPAFKRGFEKVRERVIRELEVINPDGSAETEAFERELCRTLRTLNQVRRAVVMSVQNQQLQAADFKPQAQEKGDE